MIVTDLSNSFHPVPKERKIEKTEVKSKESIKNKQKKKRYKKERRILHNAKKYFV